MTESSPTSYDPRVQIRDEAIKAVQQVTRAKVEGLPFGSLLSPHSPACPGRPGYRGICNCERLPRQYLWRSDVLALLEEVSE